jgi:hypothetical protein
VSIDVRARDAAVTANVDAEQVQRALLSLMLAGAPSLRHGCIVLTTQQRGEMGQITVDLEGATSLPAVGEIFEPFPTSGHGDGLAIATAGRLIENQRGAIRAEIVRGRLRYTVDFPVAKPEPGDAVGHPPQTSSRAQTSGRLLLRAIRHFADKFQREAGRRNIWPGYDEHMGWAGIWWILGLAVLAPDARRISVGLD